MGGGKGGSSDQSGMYMAAAAAQAADKAYQLGEQQFQWSQQVWNQEQPLVDQSEKQQIALSQAEQKSLEQMSAETADQWAMYQQTYAPLEQQFAAQAQNWASPEAMAQARAQAMADVGEKGMAGINTAAEQLRAYGVNPGAKRYASLYTSAQPMLGAAEAAAGTTASQNLRMQQMGLESGAINTGRGLVNTTGTLTQAGTGAGQAGIAGASGAAATGQANLAGTAVGAGATSNLFNAGSNAMSQYVNAVNGYNQTQADFAQASATEMGGFGSALGSLAGLGMGKMGFFKAAKGGPVGFAEGGAVGAIPGPSIAFQDGGASLADKYITRSGQPVQQPARVAPLAAIAPRQPARVASMADRYISPTGGPGVRAPPSTPVPEMAEHPLDTRPSESMVAMDRIQSYSPETRQFIMRSGGEDQARARLQSYPGGAPTEGAWGNITSDLMPQPQARPLPAPQVVTRPPVNLQGAEERMMAGREQASTAPAAMSANPNMPVSERFGGPIRRYWGGGAIGFQDAGGVSPAIGGSDPQLTPNQGGGMTGIPSAPMPPADQPPSDATPGGGVPAYSSPSNGVQTDDVPAMLTANEFVIPKDVAVWKGHEYFAKQIDAARRGQQQFAQRDDIGGEPTNMPQQQPTFVSRPPHMGTTAGAIPGLA